VKLAIEGGCNAVASTLGVLGAIARKYAHKIPFLLKFNHNEFLSYPNATIRFDLRNIRQAFEMGATESARPSTSGPRKSSGNSRKSRRCSTRLTNSGCTRVSWCYLRNSAFKTKEQDYHASADLTSQANHLGVTIEADIIKQNFRRITAATSVELWKNA
jgi:class I fructose-bisphosphate aldolase